MNKPALERGYIHMLMLKKQGALTTGDTIETLTLGVCTVVAIPTLQSLIVKATNGRYYSISGLSFPGACFASQQSKG